MGTSHPNRLVNLSTTGANGGSNYDSLILSEDIQLFAGTKIDFKKLIISITNNIYFQINKCVCACVRATLLAKQ